MSGRYLTHIHWLEQVLAPARPGGTAGGEGGAGGGSGGVQVKTAGPDGRIIVFDESTVAAQKVMPVFDADRGNDRTGGWGREGEKYLALI